MRIPLYDILYDCASYVKAHKIRVPDPHAQYYEKMIFAPQIKVLGNIYYYQLPATSGSKIIAWWYGTEKMGQFSSRRGFSMEVIRNFSQEKTNG